MVYYSLKESISSSICQLRFFFLLFFLSFFFFFCVSYWHSSFFRRHRCCRRIIGAAFILSSPLLFFYRKTLALRPSTAKRTSSRGVLKEIFHSKADGPCSRLIT